MCTKLLYLFGPALDNTNIFSGLVLIILRVDLIFLASSDQNSERQMTRFLAQMFDAERN